LGHPIGIATVNVDGRWYPSLFYSIADAALHSMHQSWPTTAIAPSGADVPNEAAEDFLQDIVSAKPLLAIQKTSPVEMAVLHDMGQAVVNATKTAKSTGVLLGPIVFDDRRISPTEVDAVIQRMGMVLANGQKVQVNHTGDCYTVTTAGKQ